ncbi:MAG: hypothetical protein WBV56_06620, partial [Azonexus sp.]
QRIPVFRKIQGGFFRQPEALRSRFQPLASAGGRKRNGRRKVPVLRGFVFFLAGSRVSVKCFIHGHNAGFQWQSCMNFG